MSKEDSGPAFPVPIMDIGRGTENSDQYGLGGMTLRTYAAIKLRQPDSGIDWLDDMIRKAKRDDFAKAALTGLLSARFDISAANEMVAACCYDMANAMIAEIEKP